MAQTSCYLRNVQITNDRGATVELRYDNASDTQRSYCGVYYALASASDCPEHTLISHHSRARVERTMEQWLAMR